MKPMMLIPAMTLLCACASTSDGERDDPPRERGGIQISAGTGSDIVDCPSRGSICYNNVVRACGELGVEEVDIMGRSRVTMAGRSGSADDPFARVDATRNPSNKPVSLRCREPRKKPGS